MKRGRFKCRATPDSLVFVRQGSGGPTPYHVRVVRAQPIFFRPLVLHNRLRYLNQRKPTAAVAGLSVHGGLKPLLVPNGTRFFTRE